MKALVTTQSELPAYVYTKHHYMLRMVPTAYDALRECTHFDSDESVHYLELFMHLMEHE